MVQDAVAIGVWRPKAVEGDKHIIPSHHAQTIDLPIGAVSASPRIGIQIQPNRIGR